MLLKIFFFLTFILFLTLLILGDFLAPWSLYCCLAMLILAAALLLTAYLVRENQKLYRRILGWFGVLLVAACLLPRASTGDHLIHSLGKIREMSDELKQTKQFNWTTESGLLRSGLRLFEWHDKWKNDLELLEASTTLKSSVAIREIAEAEQIRLVIGEVMASEAPSVEVIHDIKRVYGETQLYNRIKSDLEKYCEEIEVLVTARELGVQNDELITKGKFQQALDAALDFRDRAEREYFQQSTKERLQNLVERYEFLCQLSSLANEARPSGQ